MGLEDESDIESEQEYEKSEDMNFDHIAALDIVNGVGTAYDVPIYYKEYFECADFKTHDEFPMDDFCQKVIGFVCKSDLKIMRDLRQVKGRPLRRREVIKEDEAPCQFIKAVPDSNYLSLFGECFTRIKKEKLKINLRKYASKEQL